MILLRTLVLTFLLFGFFTTAPATAQGVEPAVVPWTLKQQRLSEPYQDAKTSAQRTYKDTAQRRALNEESSSEDISVVQISRKGAAAQADPALPPAPSKIEEMYSDRIIEELWQFGYDLFNARAGAGANTPMGAVQDNFILGAGDELEIVFSGQRTDRNLYRVDSQGMIIIHDMPPIPAAGRPLGEVRATIQNAARNLYNNDVYVSLSTVRQVGILVVGHVKEPGKQTLTVFNTVLDALSAAGGVEKTGSLRQIKLVRDGRSRIIDIYDLLMQGRADMDLNVRDGDRIIVPAIGPTVAIAGEAKRPGIYEIQTTLQGMQHEPENRSEKLGLNDMLTLGGGPLAPGKNRYLKLEVTPQGEELVNEVQEAFAPVFGDGAILMIAKGEEKRAGTVELKGHTRRPGLHAHAKNKNLSLLLSTPDILGADIYPLIGVIERWDEDQLAHTLLSFPLRLVLKGTYDRTLKEGDVVHLFSNAQIAALQGEKKSESDGLSSLIADYLRERAAFVRGAVRKPGAYPVDQGTTLDSLLAVAGGLTLEASTQNIEITSDMQGEGHQAKRESGTRRIAVNFAEQNPQEIMIAAGDAVRINQRFQKISDKSVLIMGEVKNPGRYDLIPGDKVSDLLERAGGFTQQAYPAGAIFSRESERRAEEARFKAQARSMRQAIAAAIQVNDEKSQATKIAEAMALAEELEKAQGVGRITVEADLAKLTAQPELDMLLESGDRLYIPKRSLNVRVSGEVLSPATLQFRENKDPLDYIHEAGGFSFHADKSRTFVLYPDGSAQPLQVSSWNHTATFIPPGSTIIIPRDPEPFNFVQSAKDVSQILSNLAITGIFIDDIRD